MATSEWTFLLRSTDERVLDEEDGPGAITSYGYDIVASQEDGGFENEQVIGHVMAYRFDADGAFGDHDIVMEADDEAGDLGQVAQIFFGHEDGPYEGVSDDVSYLDLLYLSSMEIEPKWRGRGLGLKVAREIFRVHGQSANLAVMASPLESENEAERLRGQAKLVLYWQRLGLVSVPGHTVVLWHNGGEYLPASSP